MYVCIFVFSEKNDRFFFNFAPVAHAGQAAVLGRLAIGDPARMAVWSVGLLLSQFILLRGGVKLSLMWYAGHRSSLRVSVCATRLMP